MSMFKMKSLQTRLLVTGIVLTAIPLMIVSLAGWRQKTQMEAVVAQECASLAYSDLDHIAQ